MIDKDHLDYIVKEISKNINKPYMVSNIELASELSEKLVFFFPDMKMIKVGSTQFFYSTEKSKNKIIKIIEKHISDYRSQITELEKSLSEING